MTWYYVICYNFRPKLALEYQGKATKLRQKLYGDQDPRTIKSLDFFTVVYAEVGRQQYSGNQSAGMSVNCHKNLQ